MDERLLYFAAVQGSKTRYRHRHRASDLVGTTGFEPATP
jgi:hypothetical protein